MTQSSFCFDRPTPEQLNFRQGSQNARVYQALLNGPLSNVEIVRDLHILNSTGRISDIRKALRPHLMDVKATEGVGGQWTYSIAPPCRVCGGDGVHCACG